MVKWFFYVFVVFFILFKVSWAQDVSFLWDNFLKGNYQRVISVFDDYKVENYAEIYYLLGMSYLGLGDTYNAKKNLSLLLEKFPYSEWHDSTEIALGDCFLIERDFDKAKDAYVRFIEKNKKSMFLSLAYLKLAEIKRKQGLWDEAKKLYEKIKVLFPNSLEAKIASEILSHNEFHFAFQIGSFVNKDNAKRLVEELENKGFFAYISEYVKLGQIYYRVKVGNFLSRKESEEIQKKLVEAGYIPLLCP